LDARNSRHVSVNALKAMAARRRDEVTERDNSELLQRMDDAITRRNLLQHPFYRDWQAGTLSRERLRLYAAQYYWHVEAFPVHIKALAERASGTLREGVLENLAEEENPAAPHPKLWRDFATAVGVNEEALWTSAPLPAVEALVDVYGKICGEGSLEEAVSALYGYEAQVPEIAPTKMDALRRDYNVTSSEGLAYFAVHEEADRVHRAAWRKWLEENCAQSDLDESRVLATAQTALDALWGALDAVQADHC
jgi:pyrroloquinoline-quinone synthase